MNIDKVHLFCLKAAIIEGALHNLNDRGIRIKAKRRSEEERLVMRDFVPQFSSEGRISASEMARYYEIFYALENHIRQLILVAFDSENNTDWWKAVPKDIRDRAESAQAKELNRAVTLRSEQLLEYTTFGELGQIISANWEIFASIFKSRKALEDVTARLNMLRGPIAHNGVLERDEVVRLMLSIRDLFRLMA
jgi:hypothetical protein